MITEAIGYIFIEDFYNQAPHYIDCIFHSSIYEFNHIFKISSKSKKKIKRLKKTLLGCLERDIV